MMRTAARISLPLLLMACAACGGRPFAEGGSRELLVVTSLPADSPEILFLRAILERPAIRIEDETAYLVRLASPDDRRVYRARTLLFVGYGRSVPKQLLHLEAIRAGTHAPFVFSHDPWLRGQAAGIVWPGKRDDLLPLLQQNQNRLFADLDRATFATVRARLLALPRDAQSEKRLRKELGFSLRVPRGYDVRTDPETHAALLLDPGPPTRLLRVAPDRGLFPAQDLRSARASLRIGRDRQDRRPGGPLQLTRARSAGRPAPGGRSRRRRSPRSPWRA